MLVEHAEPSGGVAKRDHVLSQQPDPDGRAVGLCDFFRHAGRHPVRAHELAHRGRALDAA